MYSLELPGRLRCASLLSSRLRSASWLKTDQFLEVGQYHALSKHGKGEDR